MPRLLPHRSWKNTAFFLFMMFQCLTARQVLNAQDTLPEAKHAAVIFPYPMYQEHWRSSIGFTLLTTPEDITEEVRLRVPAIDVHVLRKITSRLQAEGRGSIQVLQNHFSAGLKYVAPVGNRVFVSVGGEAGYWFGFLKVEGFNSKASGWLAYPNVSLGIRTRKDLLITLRAQTSFNLYYKAFNGTQVSSSANSFYNGETFTVALEQPFYHHKHITLAFSTINNYFYWQTWSLFYKVNRKIFYPQVTVAFIL
jgi:hypothetical protein